MIPAAYRSVLATPAVPSTFVTSLLARLPQGMVGLAVVLLVAGRTGSYGTAGLVSGVLVAATAVAAPAVARLADAVGARPVLLVTGPANAAGLLLLALVPARSSWLLVVLAALAGIAAPPATAASRALWPRLLPDAATLAAVYALDATAQELLFIVGPLLVAACLGLGSPALAVSAAALIGLVGTLLLATRRPFRERQPRLADAGAGQVLGRALLPAYAAAALLVGGLAATEVGIAASAGGASSSWAVGVLFGVWSLGSLVGGLVAGARGGGGASTARRLPVLLAAVAAGHGLLAASPGLVALGALLALAGAAVAPAFSELYGVAARSAPDGARTRVFAWLATFMLAGASAGSAAGGAMVDAVGPPGAFLIGAALPALATVLLLLRARRRLALPRGMGTAITDSNC